MFRSVKIKNTSVTVFSLACLIVFVLVCFFMLRTGVPQTVSIGGEEYSLRAEDDTDIRAFLDACGAEGAELVTEREITVPKAWNKIYESYQELQKAQGLDLEPYRGKPARELIYASADRDDYAAVLVSGGRIIAAHRCTMLLGDAPRALIPPGR